MTCLAFACAITSSLSEGVYTLDRVDQFTLVNAAAEHMLGWTEAELLGKQFQTIIPLHAAQLSTLLTMSGLSRFIYQVLPATPKGRRLIHYTQGMDVTLEMSSVAYDVSYLHHSKHDTMQGIPFSFI